MLDTATTYTQGNKQLLQAITAYINYRLETSGKKFTTHALDLALKRLDEYGQTTAEKIEILETSISRGWTGIFPLDKQKTTPQNTQTQEDRWTYYGGIYRRHYLPMRKTIIEALQAKAAIEPLDEYEQAELEAALDQQNQNPLF